VRKGDDVAFGAKEWNARDAFAKKGQMHLASVATFLHQMQILWLFSVCREINTIFLMFKWNNKYNISNVQMEQLVLAVGIPDFQCHPCNLDLPPFPCVHFLYYFLFYYCLFPRKFHSRHSFH